MNDRAPAEVRIQIDRLLIEGLPLDPRHVGRFRRALESELAALLSGPSEALSGSVAVPSVRASGVSFRPGGSPESWAASVARSVHGGLRG